MIPSRRDFLRQSILMSSAAIAAGPLRAVQAAQEKPGSRMRLGLVTYLWAQDWDLPTILTNCQKVRILGVELRSGHKHGVEPSLTDAQRREVKKRFADSSVVFLGPGSNERFDSPDREALEKSIEATKGYVRLSHDCGGSGVKVKPNSFQPGVQREQTIEQIGKSLNIVGKFAADYGQQIRLEVHGSCAELPTMKAIMDVADHAHVALCWNSNAQDLQGQGLEYNFNLVKDRFGATAHVHELNSTGYPFQQFIDLLVKMDYPGWLLLECSSSPQDRLAALIEQGEIFGKMVANAQEKRAS